MSKPQTCKKDSLNFLLIYTCKSYRARSAERLAELGVHVGQEMILLALWEKDGRSLSDLVERLKVQPPTVTRMVQRMESADLVKRYPCENDSRVSRVYLSQKGKDLQADVETVWQELEQQLTQGMTPEEGMLFRRLLMQATDNLNPSTS